MITVKSGIPGSMLMKAIVDRCVELNQDPSEVAPAQLGIGKVYFGALCNGRRDVAKMDDAHLRKAAEFIGAPLLQIYLLAGKLKTEDCYFTLSLDVTLNNIYKSIVNDPVYCTMAPTIEQWEATPRQSKICLASLWESYIGEKLLPKAIAMENIAP